MATTGSFSATAARLGRKRPAAEGWAGKRWGWGPGRQPLPLLLAHLFLMSSPGFCSGQDAERQAQAVEARGPSPALSPGLPTFLGMRGWPWGPAAPQPGRALHEAGAEDGFEPRQ